MTLKSNWGKFLLVLHSGQCSGPLLEHLWIRNRPAQLQIVNKRRECWIHTTLPLLRAASKFHCHGHIWSTYKSNDVKECPLWHHELAGLKPMLCTVEPAFRRQMTCCFSSSLLYISDSSMWTSLLTRISKESSGWYVSLQAHGTGWNWKQRVRQILHGLQMFSLQQVKWAT